MVSYRDAIALGEQGRYAEAEAMLRACLDADPDDARARTALERTLFLLGRAPRPATVEACVRLAEKLTFQWGPAALRGSDEGPRLQKAVEIIEDVRADLPQAMRPRAAQILWRAGRYDSATALGDLTELGRLAATHDLPGMLLYQLPKVETDADRLELLRQHRLWGSRIEAAAAGREVSRPSRDAARPLRIGFLSSDLRNHVVGFFTQPLFQHRDPRFELFCYSSFSGAADVVQQWFTTQAAGYRQLPADDREAAEMIAADGLDLLVDLGGPTGRGRPGVLAFRPAPLQAGWLGYAHSLGLAAVDHFIADPWLAPPRAELLLERALVLPSGFLCMSPAAFPAEPALEPVPPMVRTGRVTFGTANDTYKFNPRLLRTWARILAAIPGSRFMIVRPEAGAPIFRESVARYFAQEGVGADRLDFRPIRGGVRPVYADMDIALDTFPVTGGTTTCEALWMGVPTVTLVGDAPYERLSWSILNNAGLADLGAASIEDYVCTAVELAQDPERLASLRSSMRERIALHALGRPAQFAAGFFETMAGAIARSRAA